MILMRTIPTLASLALLTVEWTLVQPPRMEIRLEDATPATGILFQHRGGDPRKVLLVEEMSGGVGLIDYDEDGFLDIYLVTGMAPPGQDPVRNTLYQNQKDGTFRDVTDSSGVGFSGWSMGVSAADYDGDGHLDLYVTNAGPNVLYRNNGNGSFSDVTRQAGLECPGFSTGSAFADYDGDGDLDLFVANYVVYDLADPPMKEAVCQYRGLQVACGPRGMQGAADVLYRNNGDGTFADVSAVAGIDPQTRFYGLGVLWSDLDQDGDQDLFVANDSTPNLLYVNSGHGTFTDSAFLSGVAVGENAESQACMGVDVADQDGDGLYDIFVTNFSEEPNTLYRGRPGFLFEDATHESGLAFPSFLSMAWGTKWFDVDADGDLDLFVANGHIYPQVDDHNLDISYRQPNQLFLNEGPDGFRLAAGAGSGMDVIKCSRGAAFGDLDNDGDIDIVVNNLDDSPTVLRNQTRGGHWLQLELRATGPNPFAIGARATIRSRGRQQAQELRSGGSYLSQNDLRLHFGLGEESTIEQLEIFWPDGSRQTLENVKADRLVRVKQPAPSRP